MIEAKFYEAARDFLAILGVPKTLTAKPINDMKKGTYLNASYYDDVLICWGEWILTRPPVPDGREQARGRPGVALDEMHWGAGKESKRIKSIAELDVVIMTYTALMQDEEKLRREIRSWSVLAATAWSSSSRGCGPSRPSRRTTSPAGMPTRSIPGGTRDPRLTGRRPPVTPPGRPAGRLSRVPPRLLRKSALKLVSRSRKLPSGADLTPVTFLSDCRIKRASLSPDTDDEKV